VRLLPQELGVTTRIEDVHAHHATALTSLPGVVGTAIGLRDGVPCILVFLLDRSGSERVPASLEGYRVKTEVTGPIRTRDART